MKYCLCNISLRPAHLGRPNISAALGSALISGGTSLGSSILGFLGQKSANKTNRQIAADTNAANLQIARETNQANLDMYNLQHANAVKDWQLQNQYESPAAYRSRLIMAGINPSVMAQANLSGSNSISQPSSAPAVGAEMRGYDYKSPLGNIASTLGSAGSDAVSSYYMAEKYAADIQKTKEERYMLSINNSTLAQENMLKIERQIKELESQGTLNETQKANLAELRKQHARNQVLYDLSVREQEATYDNLLTTGKRLEEEVKYQKQKTVDEHAINLQTVASMKNSDIVAMFNAKTQRKLADAQVKHYNSLVDELYLLLPNKIREGNLNVQNLKIEGNLKRLQKHILGLDFNQKSYIATMLAIKLQREHTMSQSFIRLLVNRLLGVDVQDAIDGLGHLIH